MSINVFITFAKLVRVCVLLDDLSNHGLRAKLKSPPKINLWVSRFGKVAKKEEINCSSSWLGAYMLARTTGIL